LLGDRPFFEWLEDHWSEVFAGAPARGNLVAPREYAVLKSVQAKAAIVARDERETGDRMLLNLGHTFGHAFEAAAGFSDRLLHGEAIGLGMALAFEFSARRGLIAQAEAARAVAHLAAVGLPTHLRDAPGDWPGVDAMMELVSQDKKVRRGRLTLILLRGIGDAFVEKNVDSADMRAFLEQKLAE
jgi:3-dehydroquinate synthetase